jgi:hypothetical protein
MGLLKGNFSFAQFHVEGQLPPDFLDFVNNRIKANSFRETAKKNAWDGFHSQTCWMPILKMQITRWEITLSFPFVLIGS